MTEKSVAEKARIKPGTTIALVNPTAGVVESLGLPADVAYVSPTEARLVFLFASSRAELETQMPPLVAGLAPEAALWVFFRKRSKTAGLDMNRDTVWALAEELGMRPLGLVGVDATWSAFRLRRAQQVAGEDDGGRKDSDAAPAQRSRAGSIDEYIAEFPADTRKVLEEMRELIRSVAPEAVETISYAIPTFDLNGTHLVHFAGYKNHVGFYPTGRGADAFAEEIKGYKAGKGSVQFPLGTPLPVDLIRRIVEHRVADVTGKE